jgi:DNA-binding transcriptional regulator YiaG
MMSQDVQKLHDAVLLMGDAALEIATALSALGDGALEPTIAGTGAGLGAPGFKRPGDPKPAPVGALLGRKPWLGPDEKPAPSGMNITSGEPLTPERFQRLVTSVDEPPPPPPVAKSYATGSVLSSARAQARKRAAQRAANAGYDYEHWCKRVREVRLKIGVGARGLGDLLGVTPSGVQNWETGVCFAKGETRAHLERVSAHLCGATHASWRKPE